MTDVVAVLLSIGAPLASSKLPKGELTYGYHRFEVLASLLSSVSLSGVALYIVYETYSKLFSPQNFNVSSTIILGLIALTLNLFAFPLINPRSGKQLDLNLASTRYHMLVDGLSSVSF